MHFISGRIRKIIKEINKNIYSNRVTIKEFMMKDGYFKGLKDLEASHEEWKVYKCGDFWGGRDYDAWFRFDISIPEEFKGKTIALYVSTGIDDLEKEETTINPQMLLYLDGKIIQGLDINHREVILSKKSKGCEKYQADIKVNSGMYDRKVALTAKIVTIDEDTRELYYNIKVPYDTAVQLPDGDYRKLKIIEVLNETINLIDFREPNSKAYNESIKCANNYINEEFYNKICGSSESVASVIGHTHIDVAWLWTVAQTREKVARSFSTVLNLMEQYPEYKFMSSMPQLYKFLKEDYPELYSKVKERVKEGRWEADGAMWVEADCNLASGEGLVRQILYGTKFFREEFGVECSTLWLPDVFGYCAALPQIMKKSDIKYFMSCKMGWNDTNRMPYDTFMWKGIDGSEILTHLVTTTYPRASVTSYATDYNGQLFPETVMGAWNKYRHKTLSDDVLISFGYGDGGGGPTKEMLENNRRMSKGIPGCPKTEIRTVNEYFNKLEEKVKDSNKLPRWVGEMYFEFHRGTYTSMARNKKSNRKCEFGLLNAEQLNTMSLMINNEYPKEELDKHWELVLKNHFHDILPGSCIKEVYDVTKEEYEQTETEIEGLINKAVDTITSKVNLHKDSIVVYNTLSFKRDDIVEVQIPKDMSDILLVDEENNNVEYQMLAGEAKNKLVFLAEGIPSNGYKSYKIMNKNDEKEISQEIEEGLNEFIISKNRMSNKFFNINIDEKGTFTSIYDKVNNREVLKENERGNKLLAFEDKPMAFDNWNISMYYKEKMWEVDQVKRIQIIEDGSIRKVLEIEKDFSKSKIIQKIIIYKDIPRIDFDTYVDWKETDVLLKASFPVDINTDKATFDVQFGNVERTTHNNTSWDAAQYEVSAHKWADISEGDYGVSLLNESKYGYDIKGENLNITLLKSGTYPNPEADKEEHSFVYSLYPHKGNWKEAKTNSMALKLNIPVISKYEKAHTGILPEKLSIIDIDCDNVVIEVIKKAEDSNNIIVRMHELYNRRTKVNLNTYYNLKAVIECNLMEKELQQLQHHKNNFTFEIKPYEIKTFKLVIE
jgi:alpha-mannosidase